MAHHLHTTKAMLKALKVFTALACIVCFVLNTFGTFKKFFDGSKLVVTSTQENNELPLPVLLLCQESAFTEMDSEGIMRWSKGKYLNRTTDPAEISIKKLWSTRVDYLVNYTLGTLNTMFSGRCMTITIHQTVSGAET